MPRDGSGNYTLPAGNPVVTNTVITSSWANSTLSDIAAALTASLPRDGSAGMLADLNFNTHKGINLVNGSNPQDAVALSQLTAVQNSAYGVAGFKNLLINGDMRVQQRGSGFSVPPNNNALVYSQCDRWHAFSGGSTGCTMYIQSYRDPSNGDNYSTVTVNTPPTNLTGGNVLFPCSQHIEGLNLIGLVGTPLAVSGAISSTVTGQVSVALNIIDSSGTAIGSYVHTVNIASSNTKTKFSFVTPPVPSNMQPRTDNGSGLRIIIGALNTGSSQAPSNDQWLSGLYQSAAGNVNWAATTNNTFSVTEVQIERAAAVTSFERRPFGTELVLCERYFEVIGQGVSNFRTNVCNVSFQLTSSAEGILRFRTRKRIDPNNVGFLGGATASNFRILTNGGAVGVTGMNFAELSPDECHVVCGVSGSTPQGFTGILQSQDAVYPRIYFQAEL